MNFTQLFIILLSLFSVIYLLILWRYWRNSRGIFRISGIFIFKILARLSIFLLFFWLFISYLEPNNSSKNLAEPVKAIYQVPQYYTLSKESWQEAQSVISEDLKRTQPVYVSLVISQFKNKKLETLIPATPLHSFLSLIENPEVLNLRHSILQDASSKSGDRKGGIQEFSPITKLVKKGNASQEFTLTNQETSYFTFLSSNNWTELVDMKVYLLILLLILITSDLLFILHIIKI
ncbi:hypothetical protein PQG46_09545 [Aquirufa nivalisilvae]|uniref:Uncharacterized protein n=1 Tax=Aquirufa nivalisilvae TaxID=2516557 RepID=A0A2S2DWV4_9BACT|nr:hypothetical protein [Aquirufa nivalisilvae]AWL09257.1 hypothetical protein HME7025_01397 [Aquirufa nivalisilvae]MCZ2480246.1 hypothetical protein [Aquirufa nivalisilvae]TBH73748.1 hypothetical protein EWU22_08745 [Aquirufa nivalisilvae]